MTDSALAAAKVDLISSVIDDLASVDGLEGDAYLVVRNHLESVRERLSADAATPDEDGTMALRAVRYDGENRRQMVDQIRKWDAPLWGNEREFGTDNGHFRDEDGLPVGEPAMAPSDLLIRDASTGEVLAYRPVTHEAIPEIMAVSRAVVIMECFEDSAQCQYVNTDDGRKDCLTHALEVPSDEDCQYKELSDFIAKQRGSRA